MSLAGRWRAWCVKCGSWHGPGSAKLAVRKSNGGMWRLADGRLTAGGLGRDPCDHPRSLLA